MVTKDAVFMRSVAFRKRLKIYIKEREDMNMFWVELILVLAIIFLGVRKGGTFLAMAGGVGMLIMTFFFHVTPADPPVTVILIMIAVIVAAATMQACGGLDFLVRKAEKILRRNPRMITVLAPVVAYIFHLCVVQVTLFTVC